MLTKWPHLQCCYSNSPSDNLIHIPTTYWVRKDGFLLNLSLLTLNLCPLVLFPLLWVKVNVDVSELTSCVWLCVWSVNVKFNKGFTAFKSALIKMITQTPKQPPSTLVTHSQANQKEYTKPVANIVDEAASGKTETVFSPVYNKSRKCWKHSAGWAASMERTEVSSGARQWGMEGWASLICFLTFPPLIVDMRSCSVSLSPTPTDAAWTAEIFQRAGLIWISTSCGFIVRTANIFHWPGGDRGRHSHALVCAAAGVWVTASPLRQRPA